MSDQPRKFTIAFLLFVTTCTCITLGFWVNSGETAAALGWAFTTGALWAGARSKSEMFHPLNKLTLSELVVLTIVLCLAFGLMLPAVSSVHIDPRKNPAPPAAP